MKYLIIGLGNIGDKYINTRHNIGFAILDALAKASNVVFEDKRYGFIGEMPYKGRKYLLLKPSTFVNLSGRAVQYWIKKKKIPHENILVVVDDVALPFGVLRLKKRGGDGGHNGLLHISQVLGTQYYSRLRFGIGSEFSQGTKVKFVLGEWAENEASILVDRINIACDIIKSFGFHGVDQTMNTFNNK